MDKNNSPDYTFKRCGQTTHRRMAALVKILYKWANFIKEKDLSKALPETFDSLMSNIMSIKAIQKAKKNAGYVLPSELSIIFNIVFKNGLTYAACRRWLSILLTLNLIRPIEGARVLKEDILPGFDLDGNLIEMQLFLRKCKVCSVHLNRIITCQLCSISRRDPTNSTVLFSGVGTCTFNLNQWASQMDSLSGK